MNPPPLHRFVLTWIALLVLLALSCGSSFLKLGVFNPIANFGIAIAKAALVITVFMHLGRGPAALRIAAAAGLIGLMLLVGLSATDFAMRGP